MTPEEINLAAACHDAGVAMLVAFGFALVAMFVLPFIARR